MIGRWLLGTAARRLARDPEVRRRAARAAGTAWRAAKPKVEKVGRHIGRTYRETRDEIDPAGDPAGFAKRLARRLFPEER